jgi:NADH pyrophosphatase NudC (nudix superfamily)
MSSITEPSGYNHEEATFKKQELEALAKMRAELDAKRKAAEGASAKAAHWMCCPKCGGKMAEKKFENVMIDQCTACGGIYFDAGELDMLIKHEKSGADKSGVLGRLFGR